MPKSPPTIAQAQDILAKRLHNLAPTGDLSFEALLADALTEFTGQPFFLAKSGHQEGSDVRSAPYNLFRIGLEAKRYRPSSPLPLDALLHKITDAAAARQPVDLWVLTATRSISASDREQLHLHGERCGIGVLVLDWPHEPTRLCDLAVICGAAPRTCQEILKPTAQVSEALKVIQSDAVFEQMRSQLFKQLTRADVGYANARHASERWMVEAQASLANAKSRLGGHHNLRESEFGVVSRTAINTQLDDWYTSGHGFAALLGDEGTGKSWAVLDWHERLRSSAAGAPMIVFLRATAIDASKDVKSAIAHALSTQTSVGSFSFWENRLQLWESCQGEESRWRRGRLRDLVSAREVLLHINETLKTAANARGVHAFEDILRSAENPRRAFDAMPSFEVAVTLKTAIHRNGQHRWTNNHIHDIHALASTLPYCDVVLTDREMVAHVRRSKLDQRLGTSVLHKLDDLSAVL